MKIADNKVALIHYTLTNADQDVLDSSEGQEPLAYIHGHGHIVPGLENALDGRSKGDRFSVTVSAQEGYGEHDERLTQAVPRQMFSGVEEIEVGMQFHAQTEQGMQVVTVVSVADDTITIDGNHPLAGQDLHFDIEVVDVRDASAEELEHGHVHGEGGHHH